MCLLGVTYLFEDNRRGWVKEGVAGVCGEGWEGRAFRDAGRCGHLIKNQPGQGAWPLSKGASLARRSLSGQMGRRAPQRDLSRERRALQNLLSVRCCPTSSLSFPTGEGAFKSVHPSNVLSDCSGREEVPGLGTHSTGGQSFRPTYVCLTREGSCVRNSLILASPHWTHGSSWEPSFACFTHTGISVSW